MYKQVDNDGSENSKYLIMNWDSSVKGFKAFLQLEKALSVNSIEAYMRDVSKLEQFVLHREYKINPTQIELAHLQEFLAWANELGMNERTQARVLSGIKSFFKYLLLEDLISDDPTELIEGPKIGRKLPETLSIEEINQLLDAIDLSKPEGQRNRAMLETLYGSGLRVSELTTLKISDIFEDDGFLKIVGKGDKERLVPLGSVALKQITIYKENVRTHLDIKSEDVDTLFLNKRGSGLSRVMVFKIIKALAETIGLKKNISPHTFRHSFATHLIEGGADLRAVQEMLGHESITTTEIYTHLDRDYLRTEIIQFHPRS